MYVAVDAMGGDHAPEEVVAGAVAAASEGHRVLLVGEETTLQRCVGETRAGEAMLGRELEIVPAEEVVGMAESPVAVRRKRRSSIRVCAQLVRDGRAAAMVSAGNTGAVMIAGKTILGTIEGVRRPALVTVLPNRVGRTVLLDVGANVDSRPRHLLQFAVMGHCYACEVLELERPRVGLLSIGEEDSKGSELTREAFEVLQATGLNFQGNVEGGDVYSGEVDVVVCDGFVGNVVLKSSEELARLFRELLKEELGQSWRTRLGGGIARPALAALARRTDYREYGAVPLLGLAAGCFIAHGRSDATAIASAIRRAAEYVEHGVGEKIRAKVAALAGLVAGAGSGPVSATAG